MSSYLLQWMEPRLSDFLSVFLSSSTGFVFPTKWMEFFVRGGFPSSVDGVSVSCYYMSRSSSHLQYTDIFLSSSMHGALSLLFDGSFISSSLDEPFLSFSMDKVRPLFYNGWVLRSKRLSALFNGQILSISLHLMDSSFLETFSVHSIHFKYNGESEKSFWLRIVLLDFNFALLIHAFNNFQH